MPSDFKQWQKDSPYGGLVERTPRRAAARIEQSCPESQRCFGEPKAHLFGVCCIIRPRELWPHGRAYCLSFFFPSSFPDLWKTSFGNILCAGRRAVGRIRRRRRASSAQTHFRKYLRYIPLREIPVLIDKRRDKKLQRYISRIFSSEIGRTVSPCMHVRLSAAALLEEG